MARRRPRDITVPHSFTSNSYYPRLGALAADLKTQELMGDQINLTRRWKNAHKIALTEVLREKLDQDLIKIETNSKSRYSPFMVAVPLTEDEVGFLEWFRTEGNTKQ